jgi:hypothetical protein
MGVPRGRHGGKENAHGVLEGKKPEEKKQLGKP